MSLYLLTVCAVACVLWGGCAHTPKTDDERAQKAYDVGIGRVWQGIDRAVDATNKIPVKYAYARKNPSTACSSTNYELYIYGGWRRVVLRPPSGAFDALDQAIAEQKLLEISFSGEREKIDGRSFEVYNVRF